VFGFSASVVGLLVGAALVTSIISGILGMAGGITLLGVMAALLPAPVVVPLHGVVQLGSNGTRALAFLRHVRWWVVAWFAPALIVGTAASTRLYAGGELAWLKPVIGGYLLFFVVWRRKAPVIKAPPAWSYGALGLLAGFVALYVGATGPLLAPFFLREDFAKEEIIGTKAACQILVHLAKLPAFLALGFAYQEHLPLLGLLLVAVVCGTLIGKRILQRMKTDTFVMLFEGVLVLLGLLLIVRGVLAA
jgi:uncharacterized membrane protein YfcA